MIDLKKNIDRLCGIAQQLDNKELCQVSLFLRQRINQPDSYIVFLGESCSGKSTIINSIIEKGILPVSSVPSTGAIAEVFVDSSIDQNSYAVINRNATMELLDYSVFCELARKPDPDVQRLRAVLPSSGLGIAGVRIFDTPGYGSLIEAHDEVLMDFLPNCDSVVYTVGYKNGIQETDYEFLRKLKELTRPGIPIYLAINRCPVGTTTSDRRVAEIYRAVKSLLVDQEVPLFLIPSTPVKQGLFRAPVLDDLRARIVRDINSPDRQHDLYLAFLSYLSDLTILLRSELERQIRNLEMDVETARLICNEMEQLADKFQHAINGIVRPGFDRIRANFPKYVSSSHDNIEREICNEIRRQSTASMDEMIAYTNTHLLPDHVRKGTEEIQHYLYVELDAIDQEVDNYLNTVVSEFEKDIQLRFSSSTFEAGARVVKDAASKLLNTSLLKYFAKYGGRGGAGAGVANATSHALKQIGDMFGHTFQRETHNAVKHAMKKIGLTSAKTISAAVSAVLEVATITIEYGTWKTSLISKVKKGLATWETQTIDFVRDDIDKLEAENIDAISAIAKNYADAYAVDEKPVGDVGALRALLASLEEVEKEITA